MSTTVARHRAPRTGAGAHLLRKGTGILALATIIPFGLPAIAYGAEWVIPKDANPNSPQTLASINAVRTVNGLSPFADLTDPGNCTPISQATGTSFDGGDGRIESPDVVLYTLNDGRSLSAAYKPSGNRSGTLSTFACGINTPSVTDVLDALNQLRGTGLDPLTLGGPTSTSISSTVTLLADGSLPPGAFMDIVDTLRSENARTVAVSFDETANTVTATVYSIPMVVKDVSASVDTSMTPAQVTGRVDTVSPVTYELFDGAGTVVSSGTLESGEFAIDVPPTTVGGSYVLRVTGPDGFTVSPIEVIPLPDPNYRPAIVADNATVQPGETTTITINGTGFTPDAQVTIALDGDDKQIEQQGVTADANGAFSARFSTGVGAGTYTVSATDATQTVTATVTVTEEKPVNPNYDPKVTAQDQEIEQGATTTISGTGSGFNPDEQVTVELRDSDGNTLDTAEVTSDAEGNVDYRFSVQVPAGTYTVNASDNITTVSATVKVTEKKPPVNPNYNPKVTAQDQEIEQGATTTISGTGSGFNPDERVKVELQDSSGTVLDTVRVKTDSIGNLDYRFNAQVGAGTYTVSATDSTQTITATVKISEKEPPVNPNYDPKVSAQDQEIEQGATTTISGTGSGFNPEEQVRVELLDSKGAVIDSTLVTSDGDGNVDYRFTASVRAGTYIVNATDRTTTVSTTVRVTERQPPVNPDYDPSVSSTSQTIYEGTVTQISGAGTGFLPGAEVRLNLYDLFGNTLDTIVVSADSEGTLSFRFNSSVGGGYFTISAYDGDSTVTTGVSVFVIPKPVDPIDPVDPIGPVVPPVDPFVPVVPNPDKDKNVVPVADPKAKKDDNSAPNTPEIVAGGSFSPLENTPDRDGTLPSATGLTNKLSTADELLRGRRDEATPLPTNESTSTPTAEPSESPASDANGSQLSANNVAPLVYGAGALMLLGAGGIIWWFAAKRRKQEDDQA